MPDASGHMVAASGILLAFSSILCYNYFYKFFQYTMEASYEIHRIAQPPYRDKLPCLWRIMEPRRYWKNIDEQSELNAYVRSMRNACNKFLSKCPDKKEFRCYACQPGNIDNWIFTSAIGELRGVFGVMIGQIAKAYGLDVEDDLAQIIPE